MHVLIEHLVFGYDSAELAVQVKDLWRLARNACDLIIIGLVGWAFVVVPLRYVIG